MKKLITLLCAVCLLLGIISAQAEEQSPVYALTRIREDGEAELLAVCRAVMNGSVKYCPHGRPVAIKLTKTDLEKQFKRA